MRSRSAIFGIGTVLVGLGGCGSMPEQVETLEQARSAVETVEREPLAEDVSPERYQQARDALARAEEAYEENEDLEIIEHEAYIALRNAQIAQQAVAERQARDELEQGEAERNRVLLEAREREAQQAQALAAERGEEIQQQEQALETRAREAEQAGRRAEQLEEQAQTLQQETEELEQQLAELEAEQTERGWVMILEDVLFDFDQAELNPGAESRMDQIAQFLGANPGRNIVIEGHTDSSGAATYNRELARQRANAVRQALSARGVNSSRIEIRALGEEFPVASNDTTAGRQLNRRVEVVLSNETGEFQGEQRAAAAEPTEEQG